MLLRRLALLAAFTWNVGNVAAQKILYYNAHIFNTDSTQQGISYFVVDHGRIVETGKEITPGLVKTYVRAIDLKSSYVLPGLIDSHIHFIDGGLGLIQVSFFDVFDKQGLVDKIKTTQDQLIDGMYIGRDLGNPPLDSVSSALQLLDDLMPNVPVIIFLKSGHEAIANTAGMKQLGFTSTSSNDNSLPKDVEGRLTGYLLEGSAMAANRIIGTRYSAATIQKATLKAQTVALSYGITTIGDNTFNPYFFKVYQQLQKNGLLKLRVRSRSYGAIPQTQGLMKGLGMPRMGFISSGVDFTRVKYHAMKYFEDMSLSSTASKGAFEPGGKVLLDEDHLNEIFSLHPQSTFAFHTQGKNGIQNILNTVQAAHGNKIRPRHIIDHAGYTSAQQMQEASRLGLGVTMIGGQLFDHKKLSDFYRHHSPADKPFIESDFLNTKVKYQRARGALSSDYPYGMDTLFTHYPYIDGMNPFPIMAVNVSGKYPDGSVIKGTENKTITTQEAIKAYTSNGAFVLGEENRLGKIDIGYYADFIVLQNKIESDSGMNLYLIRVASTYIGGEQVFDSRNKINDLNNARTLTIKPYDFIISPVFGYDPTLGLVLGGAYFRFPLKTPGKYFDSQLQATLNGKISLQSNYIYYDLFKNVDLGISGSFSNFLQYYFGEGGNTKADEYSKLYANNYRLKPELRFRLKNKFQWSVYGDFRGRKETRATDENDNNLNTIFFRQENNVGVGGSFQHDTRDNTFSTKKGTLKLISATYIPAVGNVRGLGNVLLFNADIRHFRFIKKINTVLASRLAAGYTLGDPSYLFEYAIGGSYALRGDYSNRFRGKKFYVAQLETRFPIYKRFSGATFFDAGDITAKKFDSFHFTYGVGLRYSLNEDIKLRLDYGVAKDQNGIFFTFSEAF